MRESIPGWPGHDPWALSFMKSGRAASTQTASSEGKRRRFFRLSFLGRDLSWTSSPNSVRRTKRRWPSPNWNQRGITRAGNQWMITSTSSRSWLRRQATPMACPSSWNSKRAWTDLQDRIAEMVQGRPDDDDPEEWYAAARVLDANRAANQAFHGTQRVAAFTPTSRTPFPAPRAPAPTSSVYPTPTPRHHNTPECLHGHPISYTHGDWRSTA